MDKNYGNELYEILDAARYAPSVNNTQAWQAKISGQDIRIRIDSTYMLNDGDPTQRQTFLSLGIFCEAICQVALEKGYVVNHVVLSDSEAIISLSKTGKVTENEATKSLRSRCTDRSIYQPTTINDAIKRALKDSSTIAGTRIWVSTDRSLIHEVANLTNKAMKVALSSSGFRRELIKHLIMPWSSNKRGIAVSSLYMRQPLATLKLLLLRLGFGIKAASKLEKRCWLSASAVVIVTADGDMPKFWFAAGRSYLQVSLAIEKLGLSQATSAAIVEASNYHEDIEARLGTNQRILAILRIGSGSKVRHYSPRVDLETILLH